MKAALLWISTLAVATIALYGCRPTEKDVTHSARYPGFSSFAGTVWKTRVKVALADEKIYTGAHHLTLLAPASFDPAASAYRPPIDTHVVTVLPANTRLRIRRLICDRGEGSLLWVTASLKSGKYRGKMVYVERSLLRRNIFLHDGMSRRWGVNPKYLESDAPPRKAKGGGK